MHGFSFSGGQTSAVANQIEIPRSIIDEAVLHGWPHELFTTLIGSLPEMERARLSRLKNVKLNEWISARFRYCH